MFSSVRRALGTACRGRRHHRLQIGSRHLVAVAGDQRAPGPGHRDLGQRPEVSDQLLDLGVGGRDDLGAVTQVELVPVVRGRVVARGNHHPGRRAQVADGEREQGSGAGQREHVHRDARSGQHPGHLAGELHRPVPRVAAHHDAPLTRALLGCGTGPEQPVGHGGGRGSDHGAVHPVRARGDHAAQPSGAEVEPVREPVPQFADRASIRRVSLRAGKRTVEQRPQFGPVVRVGVIGDPSLDRSAEPSLNRHLHHSLQ